MADTSWTTQEEYVYRIREKLDRIAGIDVVETEPTRDSKMIFVKESSTKHNLLCVTINLTSVPIVQEIKRVPLPPRRDGKLGYRYLKESEHNLRVKRFEPLRSSALDAVKRAIADVQRDNPRGTAEKTNLPPIAPIPQKKKRDRSANAASLALIKKGLEKLLEHKTTLDSLHAGGLAPDPRTFRRYAFHVLQGEFDKQTQRKLQTILSDIGEWSRLKKPAT